LVLAMVCARFRDIQQIVISILQVSMFVTPIFWSPDQLRGRLVAAVEYNLLYHYVDIIRAPLLGRAPATLSWVIVFMATVVGWAIAFCLYSRFRRRIPYWL